MSNVRIKMTFEQWAGYMSQLGQKRFKQGAVRGIHRGALAAIPILHKATSNALPASDNGVIGAFNTGFYKRAWKTRAHSNGAVIFNDSPYAGIIEHGRRAGSRMPPLEMVVRWAQRRLRISEEEARKIAFPIAKAIAARGLKPRYVLNGSLLLIKAAIEKAVSAELIRELSKP